ncbi:MAG: type II secretion system protein [Vulcanimicrobiota bacterium]
MKNRAFTIIEVSLALALICISLLVMLSVFSTSSQHALQSRNRSVAMLIANSLMDDIETHTFGDPEPRWWAEETEQPVTVWVAGRQQQMVFHKTVTYENGSCVGQTAGNSDVVTVKVTWKEGVGDDQVEELLLENKELEVRVPVWR